MNILSIKVELQFALLKDRFDSILEVQNRQIGDKEKTEAMLRFMGENFAFIEINKYELLNIYGELDNQVSVIRAILIKEEIPPADLNELKALFFRNIGRDFLDGSELLVHFIELFIKHQIKGGIKLTLFFLQSIQSKEK